MREFPESGNGSLGNHFFPNVETITSDIDKVGATQHQNFTPELSNLFHLFSYALVARWHNLAQAINLKNYQTFLFFARQQKEPHKLLDESYLETDLATHYIIDSNWVEMKKTQFRIYFRKLKTLSASWREISVHKL